MVIVLGYIFKILDQPNLDLKSFEQIFRLYGGVVQQNVTDEVRRRKTQKNGSFIRWLFRIQCARMRDKISCFSVHGVSFRNLVLILAVKLHVNMKHLVSSFS